VKAFIGISAAVLCAAFGAASAKDKAPPLAFGEEAAPKLLAEARKAREAAGCLDAAPLYRVVAAMGEGEEAAQHELGECLLLIAGAKPQETALFRMEGEFWLTRAAFAGNARAQRALSVHYGSAANPDASPAEALKWALVYGKNGESDVYGYKSLPPTFAPGLKAALSPEEVAEAEAFAASFTPIALAPFKAPKFEGPDGKDPPGARPGRPPPEGERPDRR
jgi:TPR repeat protein